MLQGTLLFGETFKVLFQKWENQFSKIISEVMKIQSARKSTLRSFWGSDEEPEAFMKFSRGQENREAEFLKGRPYTFMQTRAEYIKKSAGVENYYGYYGPKTRKTPIPSVTRLTRIRAALFACICKRACICEK